jgi:hypothetical protein
MNSHFALSFKMFEKLGSVGLRIADQLDVSEEEREILSNLKWQDMDWKDIGNDGNNIVWLSMSQPLDIDISRGIIVDIQIINGTFYQIHINMAEELRGLGLGTKIYRSIVDWAGHLYSGKGRRQNPIIEKVWDSLRNERGVKCAHNDIADICVSDKNPDKEDILGVFNRM